MPMEDHIYWLMGISRRFHINFILFKYEAIFIRFFSFLERNGDILNYDTGTLIPVNQRG